ncbi:MAG TPA: DUF624 domain-containing protein [Candidatus Avipropionibacterium avicola]|uniref:DUF624 domain-containing protein n=1 Tax=Candidatus Avipropionibacterium avicola TaxID=2840701 RepID=A0A9D1GVZ6_9ACTN|nr:DUF624 domain-containing protein [Candidatus Avipropionibacterium avicola]
MSAARSTTRRLSGPIAGLDMALQWGVRLVWLNLWWGLLTLAGGVLLGFGPATVAAHGVARRWVRGEVELSVPRTMWQLWREHWRRSVAISLVAVAVLTALVATLWLARSQPPIPQAVTQGLVIVILIVMAALLPHLAWLTERGAQPDVARTYLTALAVGLGRPVLTVVLLVVTLGWPALLIAVGWPGLLPVCAVAVPIAISAWCVERVFPVRKDAMGSQHNHQDTVSDTTNRHRP